MHQKTAESSGHEVISAAEAVSLAGLFAERCRRTPDRVASLTALPGSGAITPGRRWPPVSIAGGTVCAGRGSSPVTGLPSGWPTA